VVIHAALGIYAFFGIKKKDPIAFGILFYFISLSIVSNIIIPIGSTLGERFLFTPSLGLIIAFVYAIIKVFKVKVETGTKPPTAIYGLAALLLLACSFKTIDRNKDWENNFTLFTADVESVPNSARAHFAVATSYREAGEKEMNPDKRRQFLNLSVEENQKSLKIYPLFEKAYYNLGVSYYNLGDKDNALKAYRGALNLLPNYKDALNNSGVIFFEKGIHDSAMVYFEKVIKIDPNSGGGYGNLGACYHNKGDYTKALFYYEKAIASNQGNSLVYSNMAKIYQILGETERAKLFFAKASQ
jgi:tetratricopeptide (TPR) repeat protein